LTPLVDGLDAPASVHTGMARNPGFGRGEPVAFRNIGVLDARRVNHFFDLVFHSREVVGQLVDAIDVADETAGKHLHLDIVPEALPQLVKVDAAQLRKALSYLIRYLTHNSPNDQAKVVLSVGRHEDSEGNSDVRIQVGSRTASVTPERLQRLFDPVHMVQESLIDVGPAVAQRLIEALGGQLRLRQTRHELGFQVTLPAMA